MCEAVEKLNTWFSDYNVVTDTYFSIGYPALSLILKIKLPSWGY